MQRSWLVRVLGEFAVIVLGVLVALAVDDWRRYSADRDLEAYLLAGLSDDLRADAVDLELARLWAGRREWVLNSVLTDLADGVPDGRPHVEPPDALMNPVELRRLMESQGRSGSAIFEEWDPISTPLVPFEVGAPEFDVSDDTFQEIVVSGALQTVREPTLRLELMRYHRAVGDHGENERREGQYQPGLEEAFRWVGVAVGDSLSLPELASRSSRDERVAVAMRSARADIRQQYRSWDQIEAARLRLEEILARSRVTTS
jgi:hypothetical protein